MTWNAHDDEGQPKVAAWVQSPPTGSADGSSQFAGETKSKQQGKRCESIYFSARIDVHMLVSEFEKKKYNRTDS